MFIILNSPIGIIDFFPYYNNINLYAYFTYFFNLSYVINFYVLVCTNSLFRKEFFSLFYKNTKQNINTHMLQTFRVELNQKNRQADQETIF